jgi:hypothetical protein
MIIKITKATIGTTPINEGASTRYSMEEYMEVEKHKKIIINIQMELTINGFLIIMT